MIRVIVRFCLLIGILLSGAKTGWTQQQGESLDRSLQWIKNAAGVLVSEQGTPVLQYQATPKSRNGAHRRANYVHPLYGLDGRALTQDFPSDHPHHRGVFWAWHQLYVGESTAGDGWMANGFDWDVRSTEVIAKTESIQVNNEVIWQSEKLIDSDATPMPLVREVNVIEIHRAKGDLRYIDFEIRLLALQSNLSIGGSNDAKGYGGFSVRVKQPPDLKFLTSSGFVKATKLPMDSGDWVDLVGQFGKSGTTRGIAILIHPKSAGYPQKWILRDKVKSMQNPVYPGQTPVGLSTEDYTTLRYRLVIHSKELTSADLNRAHQSYVWK